MPKLQKSWIVKGELTTDLQEEDAENLFDTFTDYVEQELDLLRRAQLS